MPRQPSGAPTYRAAMTALTETHGTVLRLHELAVSLQDQLRLLADSLAVLARRDNGRSQ
jgi:hypothetical protein